MKTAFALAFLITVVNGEQPALCQLPSKTGVCKAAFPRFFYDAATGRCKQFIYGGCDGNANNFKTISECRAACTCTLDLSTGTRNCNSRSRRQYYYDTGSGSCKRFRYSGCGGNENRFRSASECKSTCATAKCYLPSETGLCKGYFERFFYNVESGRCQNFVYGGCGGNGNNFRSKRLCDGQCASRISPPPTSTDSTPTPTPGDEGGQGTGGAENLPPECLLPKVIGRCRAAFPRYYYNNSSGRCERFLYGGCQGNKNNFWSYDACEARCVSSGAAIGHGPFRNGRPVNSTFSIANSTAPGPPASFAQAPTSTTPTKSTEDINTTTGTTLTYITHKTKDSTINPETKDTSISSETKYTTISPETKDTTISSETRDTTISSETKYTTISSETRDTTISSETKYTTISSETKYTTISPETKDTTISSETRDTTINSETKDTTISSETKDTTISPETRDTTISSETKDTTISSETKDTTISSETKDTTISPETRDTTISSETKDTTISSETKDTTISSETNENKRLEDELHQYQTTEDATLTPSASPNKAATPLNPFTTSFLTSMSNHLPDPSAANNESFLTYPLTHPIDSTNTNLDPALDNLTSVKNTKEENTTVERCQLRKSHGSCQNYTTMFAFRWTRGRCKPFVYGGCQGNANRFPDKASCLKTCRELWRESQLSSELSEPKIEDAPFQEAESTSLPRAVLPWFSSLGLSLNSLGEERHQLIRHMVQSKGEGKILDMVKFRRIIFYNNNEKEEGNT